MSEVEEVSSLIGDIYDAALDPSLWVGVLHKARAFVGGSAAAVFSKDATRKCLNVYYDDGGVDPHWKQLYFDRYAKLDPLTTGHVLAEIERPVSTVDLFPYAEFVETRFYKEWAEPQGLVDFVTAVLDRSATSAAMFGVFRHQRDGLVDDATRRRMRLIVPHIRRAVLISRTIDLRTAEAATFADVLDGLSAAMFLVDETGRIVHANASGHAMLHESSILRTAGGKLIAIEAGAAQSLSEIFPAAGGGDTALGIKGIAVPLRARDGDHYVAHVLPLTSGVRRRAGTSYAAVAALFVHKAALQSPSPPEVIAKLYGLTPSELRVLLGIVQVGGVPETAEALGVAEATVKTHLHRLFAKTGAARQADLVKLVAGFANPVVGRPRLPASADHRRSIDGRSAARTAAF
jgi:DNA-binding CsgD family transcriptional regulator/PAS domain-containing protein